MSQTQRKSRIPMAPSQYSQSQPQPNSVENADHPNTNRSEKSMDSGRSNSSAPKPKQAWVNPLAKSTKKGSKSDKKSKQSSETWYEEKVESQSQIRFQKTKTDHEKRKEELLKQLKSAEAEVEVMKNLLEQRDKLLKDAEEEAQSQISSLEEKLVEKDKALISNSIDPVTGIATVPSQADTNRREKTEKFTKKRVQDLREKLQKMDRDTESYLADIENTMQYLDSLEVASDRIGPPSQETRRFFGDFETEEDAIAKVYDENKPPHGNEPTNPKERSAESPHEDVLDDGEGNDEDESERKEHTKADFFITHHNAGNKTPSGE